MFEITVLTIAALGIYSMIKTKVKEEGKAVNEQKQMT